MRLSLKEDSTLGLNLALTEAVAEQIFLSIRKAAEEDKTISFVAVSQSDEPSTKKWVDAVGGSGLVNVIVDAQKEIFAAYGLGASSFWAVLNPWSLSNAMKLGRSENISIRPTESGSRWQTAGLFAVDGDGVVKYARKASTADDLGDVQEAIKSVKKE